MRAAFRFAPDKSVSGYARACPNQFDWHVEPALAGYTRLEYTPRSKSEPVPVPICSTPVILTDVGVMVGGYDGSVRLFDPFFTKTYWKFQLQAPIYAPLLWLPGTDCVIAADTNGTVVCLSLKGEVVWVRTLGKPIFAALERLDETERIAICCFDGVFFMLEAETGDITVQVALPRPWFVDRASRSAHRDPYASPVQIGPDRVLVSAADTLIVFDGDGTQVWRYSTGAQVRASPATCPMQGSALAMTVDGQCHLLGSANGNVITTFALGDKIVASAATSGGVAVIGTVSGAVYGVDMKSGERLWSQPHGGPFDHTGFSLLPDGNFICTNARGNVVARDSSDGRFLWESSQLIGLTGHPPRIDTIPMCAPSGLMYAGSYDGALYAFVFKEQSA